MPLRMLAAVAVLFALAACSDGPTDTVTQDTEQAGLPVAYVVVDGDAQSDTIGATLPIPITVEVRDGQGRIVVGAVVSFVVIESGCGKPYAGFAASDSLGRAADLWELGTVARDCTMEIRSVAPDGTPRARIVTATALPGNPVSHALLVPPTSVAWLGERVVPPADYAEFWDRANNLTSLPATSTFLGPDLLMHAGDTVWSDVEVSQEVVISAGSYFADTLTFSWLQDLRTSDWRLSYSCFEPLSNGTWGQDSLIVSVVLDSIVYNPESSSGTLYPPPITSNGLSAAPVYAFAQSPGVMDWLDSDVDGTSVELVPSVYEGGKWCDVGLVPTRNYQREGPVTLSKVP